MVKGPPDEVTRHPLTESTETRISLEQSPPSCNESGGPGLVVSDYVPSGRKTGPNTVEA